MISVFSCKIFIKQEIGLQGETMSTLYLIRHGETYFNKWHKIQGWCDSPLTLQGKEQAQRVGTYFKRKKIKFVAAYCSTAERTSDTLELITKQPYRRLKDLREMSFGEFEGQDERLNPRPPYGGFFVQYGGESEKQVVKRITDVLQRIMRKAGPKDNVLAVSSAGAIMNFLLSFDASLFTQLRGHFTNCSIIVLNYEQGQFHFARIINTQSNAGK